MLPVAGKLWDLFLVSTRTLLYENKWEAWAVHIVHRVFSRQPPGKKKKKCCMKECLVKHCVHSARMPFHQRMWRGRQSTGRTAVALFLDRAGLSLACSLWGGCLFFCSLVGLWLDSCLLLNTACVSGTWAGPGQGHMDCGCCREE